MACSSLYTFLTHPGSPQRAPNICRAPPRWDGCPVEQILPKWSIFPTVSLTSGHVASTLLPRRYGAQYFSFLFNHRTLAFAR